MTSTKNGQFFEAATHHSQKFQQNIYSLKILESINTWKVSRTPSPPPPPPTATPLPCGRRKIMVPHSIINVGCFYSSLKVWLYEQRLREALIRRRHSILDQNLQAERKVDALFDIGGQRFNGSNKLQNYLNFI